MKRIAILVLMAGCGASTPDGQCESQRQSVTFTCGTLSQMAVMNCAQFKGKTCDTQQLHDWVACEISGTKSACVNGQIDPSRLEAAVARCTLPTCMTPGAQ